MWEESSGASNFKKKIKLLEVVLNSLLLKKVSIFIEQAGGIVTL